MEKVLKAYLRRLNNLSGNNRALQLLRIIKEQFIDIHDFNYAGGAPSFEIIKALIGRISQIPLIKELDARDQSSNELAKRLRKLSRMDKFIFEERGAKDLYVGWPFVKGKFADGTIIRCPLIFFPVSLGLSGNTWYLIRRKDVNVTLNKSFLLAYFYYNKIDIDEDLVETVIDDYEKDSVVFRTQLYELLKNGGIEVQFNSDNFADELAAFKTYNKPQLEASEKNGVLKLFPEAVLGIFPQAGSYLVPDYLKILENNENENLEDFFVQKTKKSEEAGLNDRVTEENTFTPFPIDAYQEEALKKVKAGESIVVQGPPGTGKSQLITNVICDFIARGKNVLLVCQKRAALDVVYNRLKQRNLNDFVALVHDFKNDRKPIYEQIDEQISAIENYERKNNTLDAIQLERNYLKCSRRINQIEEKLEDFKKILFDAAECGKSVKELYLSSDIDKEGIEINLEYKHFRFPDLPATLQRFDRYFDFYDQFEKRNHFWAGGPSFRSFKTSDLLKMQEIIKEIPSFSDQITKKSKAFCFREIDFETAEHFSKKTPLLEHLISGLKEEVVFKIYKQLHSDKPDKDLPWLAQIEKTMMSCYRGAGLESTIKSDDLGKFQEVLESAIKARNRPISWLKWLLFSHEKTLLKRVMVANGLKQKNKADFEILVEKIDNRLNYEDAISQILDNPWLHNFPYNFRKISVQDWFYWQKRGLNMYYVSQNIRTLEEYLPVSQINHKEYLNKLGQLKKLAQLVPEKLNEWNKYLSAVQIRTILLNKTDTKDLIRLLRKDFDAICAYDRLKFDLLEEEKGVLDKLSETNKDKEDMLSIFQNSLMISWIDHLETKYPELRMVSSGELDSLIDELRSEVENRRQISKEILLLKLREKTYTDLEYNRLNNRITYRELNHQVTKKRRIWPIRKIVGEFGDELFKLLPCWMCSPESTSAIFPMKEQFDLIIFDEASQCFVERGIPTMYRGKQILVTGDSKQLQPNDLYRVRWEEDMDTPELSVDSLLDLTKRYLPETSLAGHYRSKSLELIEFSNQHFYKGKLNMLPDRTHMNTSEPSIEYLKVNGTWEDNVNRAEAQAVATRTIQLIEESPEKDIGIVTFNYHQQEEIYDYLEEYATKKNILLPESLIIKNIENVQGDEKDVIIFSIGYAPDKKGKMRLQFGSLNAAGGENRLNVAVTRAREKVIVISSISPNQLQTEETKNEGPKLLKKYLEYAWAVSKGNWQPDIAEEGQFELNWYLRKKLANKTFHESDYTLKKNLPFADLSVIHENKSTGLILTDDERYYSAISPKQIYVYQNYHLTLKNWPHAWFHSREYWVDKEATKDRLRKFIFSVNNTD